MKEEEEEEEREREEEDCSSAAGSSAQQSDLSICYAWTELACCKMDEPTVDCGE